MKLRCVFPIFLLAALPVLADEILLWPDGAPGVQADAPEETVKENWDETHQNRHISKVSKPTMTFYPAPEELNTGATVIICPGGGYHILAWDHEGVQVAEWLSSIGVNAVLLKYRVPAKKGEIVGFPPLQDTQRALRLVRAKAADKSWNIDAGKVGILGFSAGGNLVALTSTQYNTASYPAVDAHDQLSARPDFSVLVYPAYCHDKETGGLMTTVPVDENTPPAFLVHAQNDPIDPMCSVSYFAALTQVKVPAELHVFTRGGHGYGMWDKGENVNSWPALCADWMREMGYVTGGGR